MPLLASPQGGVGIKESGPGSVLRTTSGKPPRLRRFAGSRPLSAGGQSRAGFLVRNVFTDVKPPFIERKVAPDTRAYEVCGGGPQQPRSRNAIEPAGCNLGSVRRKHHRQNIAFVSEKQDWRSLGRARSHMRTVRSTPPAANARPLGENLTELTTLSDPSNNAGALDGLRTFQTRTILSPPAVASCIPSREKATARTWGLGNSATAAADFRRSHTRTTLSKLADASCVPSGENIREVMAACPPLKTSGCASRLRRSVQTRTVLSRLDDARRRPSAESETTPERTSPCGP